MRRGAGGAEGRDAALISGGRVHSLQLREDGQDLQIRFVVLGYRTGVLFRKHRILTRRCRKQNKSNAPGYFRWSAPSEDRERATKRSFRGDRGGKFRVSRGPVLERRSGREVCAGTLSSALSAAIGPGSAAKAQTAKEFLGYNISGKGVGRVKYCHGLCPPPFAHRVPPPILPSLPGHTGEMSCRSSAKA
jgi:hypothetical protein